MHGISVRGLNATCLDVDIDRISLMFFSLDMNNNNIIQLIIIAFILYCGIRPYMVTTWTWRHEKSKQAPSQAPHDPVAQYFGHDGHVELPRLAHPAQSCCGQAQVEAFSQKKRGEPSVSSLSHQDPLLCSLSQTARSSKGQVVKTGVKCQQTPSVTSTHIQTRIL